MAVRSGRLLARSPSIRRLRTSILAPFSTSAAASCNSRDSSTSPISTTSYPRLLPSSSSASSSIFSPRRLSFSPVRNLCSIVLLRRQPSAVDLQMEEERRTFGPELNMFEPRPASPIVGGIFEVLDGRF